MNTNDLPVVPQEPGRVGVRDLDRIREKVTLRLEPRHALLAGIGGVALLVAAFAAGLFVGRSCEQPTAEAPSRAITALVPPEDPAPPRDPTPPPARRHAVLPVAAPPPQARGPADTPIAEAPRRGLEEVSVPPPPPPVADDGPWPALAVSDPCAGHSCAVPDGGGCAVLPAPGPTFQEVLDTLARHGRARQDLWVRGLGFAARSLQAVVSLSSRWVALALRSPSASPVASSVGPRSPSPATVEPSRVPSPAHVAALASGWFTVQVRSYRDEALAREFAGSLRAEGYSVEVARHDDAEGRAWFRVRVGRFPAVGEARDFARRLNERTGNQAIVMAMEAR